MKTFTQCLKEAKGLLDRLKRIDEFFQNNEWKNFKRTWKK